MGGVILLAIDPRGSYYMITVHQWYNSKMYLKRKHFLHWLRWWCQNWNWTPLSRINEFFNSGSNYNMLIYDSYPDNIPIIRKHFLSWVRWWPSLCNLTPWWGLITHLNIFRVKQVIRPHHGVKLQSKGHQSTQERKCFRMMGILSGYES